MKSLSKVFLFIVILFGLMACTNSSVENSQQITPSLVIEQLTETSTVTPKPEPTPYPLSEAKPILLGNYDTIAPDNMRSELEQLFAKLEDRHPNLYAQRSQTEVDLERQQIAGEFGQTMMNVEFFRIVAPLVASLGDYHTRALPSNKIMKEMVESENFFPLGVELDDQQAFIMAEYSDNTQLKLGSE